MLIWF